MKRNLIRVKKRMLSVDIDITWPDGRYQVPPPGQYYLYSSVRQITSEVEIKKVKENQPLKTEAHG